MCTYASFEFDFICPNSFHIEILYSKAYRLNDIIGQKREKAQSEYEKNLQKLGFNFVRSVRFVQLLIIWTVCYENTIQSNHKSEKEKKLLLILSNRIGKLLWNMDYLLGLTRTLHNLEIDEFHLNSIKWIEYKLNFTKTKRDRRHTN